MAADERRSERTNVILKGMIEMAGGTQLPVRISNLSTHGALLIGKDLPSMETVVALRCNEFAVSGWITWSDGQRAGMQFADPIEIEALTKRAKPLPAAIVKDLRPIDFRRPGFRGNQMSDEERNEVQRWLRDQPDGSPRKP